MTDEVSQRSGRFVILSGATAGSAVEGSHAAQRSVCHPERSDRRERSRRILKTSCPHRRNVAYKTAAAKIHKTASARLCLHTFPDTHTSPSGSFDSVTLTRHFAQDDRPAAWLPECAGGQERPPAESGCAGARDNKRARNFSIISTPVTRSSSSPSTQDLYCLPMRFSYLFASP